MKVQVFLGFIFCLQLAVCKQKLHILGLYPNTGTGWTEPYVIHSAELAKRHIEQNGTILKNYELQIDWRDTECDGVVGLKAFFDAIGTNRDKTYLAVFGGGCAVATSEVAAISSQYGLVQISYASTAPNLGDINLYPRFVWGVPSDTNAVPARAKFIVENRWKRVAIINQQNPIFVASSHSMEFLLGNLNIEYRVEDFAADVANLPLETSVERLGDNLINNGYRIMIANMYEDAAIKLFCGLLKRPKYRLLLHPHSTWIFLGWFTDNWHNKPEVLSEVNCTAEEIVAVSNGALGFLVAHNESSFKGEVNEKKTISKYTTKQLYQMYRNITLQNNGNNVEEFAVRSDVHDAYVYDSLWTLALALHQAEESGFNLSAISQKEILTDTEYFTPLSNFSTQVYKGMLKQHFQGWSGNVEYRGQERVYDLVQILEFVNGSLEYRSEVTNIPENSSGYTDVSRMGVVLNSSYPFKFWNSEVASDGIEAHDIPVEVVSVIYLISFLLVAYISFYIGFIVIGKLRNLESIRNSSPTLTSIIICGNYFLVLASIFLISNDRIVRGTGQEFLSNVSGEPETTEMCDTHCCKFLCMLPVSLILVASSVILGAMMSKAALIYVVVVKGKISSNKCLNYILTTTWPFLLATVDTLFVLLWSLVGPLVIKSEVLPSGLQDPPFFSVIQCGISSENSLATTVFISILIIYKSFIVLVGLVMAYNLRNVERQSLRYGNTISWTMYNITVFTLILILSFFLIQSYDVKISIVSFLILATVFLTVTIIGLPPLYYSIPSFKPKSESNIGNIPEIVQDKEMYEKRIGALEKDNDELKDTNGHMVRRMTLSGIDFPAQWNKSTSIEFFENDEAI